MIYEYFEIDPYLLEDLLVEGLLEPPVLEEPEGYELLFKETAQ